MEFLLLVEKHLFKKYLFCSFKTGGQHLGLFTQPAKPSIRYLRFLIPFLNK
jgi:hypothetical protein